ncbi:isoamyl acetate-hydrolyzing esterase [Coemansia sp. RSA 2559]|nr:isoamyl acetate-hydrolyzing esterase [Coemansia sp. RSA 2559]KAJ2855659.1 isoamyl acetate-hydrolyzing esterase [Coemansia erecta]
MLHNAESAHYSPDTRVLIVTPPAVGEKMTAEQFNNRGWTYNPHNNTVTKMYAEAAIEVAKDMNLPFVDIWTAIERRVQKSSKHRPVLLRNSTFSAELGSYAIKQIEVNDGKDYDGYDEFLTDGLHLNSNGNELLFKLVAKTIGKNWPELLP